MSDKYIFWIYDLSILYRDGKYIEIIPTNDMTRVEQLNAMTRFLIYLLVILILFGKFDAWVYLPMIGIISIMILYNIYQNDPEGKLKEALNKRLGTDDKFEQENKIKNLHDKVNYEIQSGYYDANGNLNIGKEYSIHDVNGNTLSFTPDEIIQYQNETCKSSSKDNPFVNPTIMDLNTVDPPIACNSDGEHIKDEIDNSFNQGLYMNLDDLFGVKNSQRIWYTIPMAAVPSDQTTFANWLYKSGICPVWSNTRYER